MLLYLIQELIRRERKKLRVYLDAQFDLLKQEIRMSGTSLADQIAAANVETNAKLDAIATDVTEIGADVDTLLGGLTPGDQVTQAMVDAATSIRDRVSAVKDGLDAINAKVPATPTP